MIKYPSFSEFDDNTKNQYLTDLIGFEKEMNKLGFPIYLVYGTLLGAIREKDFIPHDTDIDIAYLSSCNTKEKVYKEREQLIKQLDSLQLLRQYKTGGIKIKYGISKFDMWTSWVIGNDYYLLPYRFIVMCSKELIFPLKKIKFRNEEFFVPLQSEKLLNIFYYDWEHVITKDKNYIKVNKEK